MTRAHRTRRSHLERGSETHDDDHRNAIIGRPDNDSARVRLAVHGGHVVRPGGHDACAGRKRLWRDYAGLSRRELFQLGARERHVPELDRLQCKGHGAAVQDRQPGDQSVRGQNGAAGG